MKLLFEDSKTLYKVKNLITHSQELINNNDFDELYKRAHNYDLWDDDNCEITKILIKANIDFLRHMSTIPTHCFQGINGLESIIIPSNVKHLEKYAFNNCSSLLNIDIRGDIPFIEVFYALDFDSKPYNIKYPEQIDWWEVYRKIKKSGFSKLKPITVQIGSEIYTYNDMIKEVERNLSRFPTLYNVTNSGYMLVAYDHGAGTPKVSYRFKPYRNFTEGYCNIYFTSTEEAEDFVRIYNKLPRRLNKVSSNSFQVAKLKAEFENFSLIETECGHCLIEKQKCIDSISPQYVIKKDYF